MPDRPTPTHVLAHVSDLHLTGAGSLVGGVVDAAARLDAALAVLTGWNVRCDAWLFTGDLSDDGSPESYRSRRDPGAAAAARAGGALVWANGNHDDRGAFRRVLLGEEGSGPYLAEHDVAGLRVLVVDTSVDGVPWGRVEADALAWLRARLRTPANAGTILVLHHAPLPQPQVATNLWPLVNAPDVAEALRGGDVRAIVSGHFHHTGFGTLAGVPVSIATSLVYPHAVPSGRALRGQAAPPGFSLGEVYPDTVVHTAVPLDPGPGVHGVVTAAEARARLAGGAGPGG